MSVTYVYCIVASDRAPRTHRAPRGLPATGPVRAIEIDRGMYAVAADAPASRYSASAINRGLSNLDWVSRAAVAHEAVVEHFIEADAVLPMKLFTIFIDDERLRDEMRRQRLHLRSMARRLGGHFEWGVRVLFDRTRAAGRGSETSARRRPARLTGYDYLSRKKARRDASERLTTEARESVSRLHDRLAEKARASKRRSATELVDGAGSVLLDAAYLVPRSRTASFRSLAAKEARALAPRGYAVTLTGPWPGYSFVQD
jgi:hypothetical protein